MPTPGPILIAYDGSDGAKAAVAAAGDLFPGRAATLVTVWHSGSQAAPAGLIAVPAGVAAKAYEELDAETARHAQALADDGAKRAAEAGLDATARPVACGRNVWSTIVDLAQDEGAAAVVVGSRGLSGVKSAVLGSVSGGVAHHATVPVVIVPHA